VVTGGAQGIGRAIAERFLESGAAVSLWDRDLAVGRAAAADLAPRGAVGHVAVDVSDAEAVERAVAATVAALGGIDILVANAGITGPNVKLWDYPVDAWRQVIDVNLNGIFLCCRAVAPLMVRQNYGRIVNVASIAGKEGNPNMTGYSATKAAVIGFTKSLAKEVATEGICVNAVAPAVVRTRILDQLTEAQIDYMTQRIPMRRTGKPEEIAAVVHFLASPDCSFVTGQCYDASGGRATY
jgi:NAD(P)-dependent dehydrogenase (short-subunit alcohol dehydrogenase family)